MYPVPYPTKYSVSFVCPYRFTGPYLIVAPTAGASHHALAMCRKLTMQHLPLLHGSAENWPFIFLFFPELEAKDMLHIGDAISEHVPKELIKWLLFSPQLNYISINSTARDNRLLQEI